MINEYLKQVDLKTRLKVLNEMYFIDLLTELGYRENTYWKKDEDDKLRKLCILAEKLSETQIQEIEEWKNDGCPD